MTTNRQAGRTWDFKAQFLKQLRPVAVVYHEARVRVADGGLRLWPSSPPVRPR